MLLICLFIIVVALFLTVTNTNTAKTLSIKDLSSASLERSDEEARKTEKKLPARTKKAKQELELA